VIARQADRIRNHVRLKYIDPARRKREALVSVRAGDVLKEMGLSNDRAPAVCGALKARKFREENNLVLEKLDGPPKKQATTVTFTYRLGNAEPASNETGTEAAFLALRGIAKEVFRSLGGGEAFIRKEREHFHGPGEDS
jgi:hypothetical protein